MGHHVGTASLHGAAPFLEEGGSATGVLITDGSHGGGGDRDSLPCPMANIVVKTAHLAELLTTRSGGVIGHQGSLKGLEPCRDRATLPIEGI